MWTSGLRLIRPEGLRRGVALLQRRPGVGRLVHGEAEEQHDVRRQAEGDGRGRSGRAPPVDEIVMLAHGGRRPGVNRPAGGVESPRARSPVARPDRRRPREARRRPEGGRPRDGGRARQEADPPQGGQHPAHRLVGLRQDDPHARGRGPPRREPRPRPALDRGPHPRERARRGGRAGPPRREAPPPADGAGPGAARGERAGGAPHRAGHPRPRLRGRGGQDPQPGRAASPTWPASAPRRPSSP